MFRSIFVVIGFVLFAQAPTQAAPPIEDACQAAKQKVAGKLLKCLHTAESKFIKKGDAAARTDAIAKCTTKYTEKWSGAEEKAVDNGGVCETTGDQAPVLVRLTEQVGCLTATLETGYCAQCGNGIVDPGEDCDFGDLNSGTCNSVSAGALPFGTLACGAGCVYNSSGCEDCTDLGGVIVSGSCWFLGADADSCDDACTTVGLSYDTATRTYAGSDGTLANCTAVLTALGYAAAPPIDISAVGYGCLEEQMSGNGGRDTAPTLAGSGGASIRRVCACH